MDDLDMVDELLASADAVVWSAGSEVAGWPASRRPNCRPATRI